MPCLLLCNTCVRAERNCVSKTGRARENCVQQGGKFSHLKNVLPHPSLNKQKWGTLIKGSYFNKYQERDAEHQQWYHFLPEKLKHKSAKPTFVRANIILPGLMKRPAENESQKPLEQYKNSWANTATSDVNWRGYITARLIVNDRFLKCRHSTS